MHCTRKMIRSALIVVSSLAILAITSIVKWTSISDLDLLKEMLYRQNERLIRIGEEESVYSDEWMATHKDIADYGDGTCHVNFETRCRSMLRAWIRLAQQYNITYSVMFGSLLGAYRDGKLIPYDTDVDVIVDIRDVRRLWKTHGDERNFPEPTEYLLPGGVVVRGFDEKTYLVFQKDFNVPQQSQRRRIMCNGTIVPKIADACSFVEPVARLVSSDQEFYVDVFAYVTEPDAGGVVHIQSDENLHVKTRDVFPLKKCRFMGLQTWCPRNADLLLNILYGDRLGSLMQCSNTKWMKVHSRT